MDTSLAWIKDYVPDLDVGTKEYTDALTLTGTKVEGHRQLDKNLEKIVVGEILSIERHPDADKLVVCQVNIGDQQIIQIVTGAPNVKLGAKVPVVLDGGKVAGGHDGAPHTEEGIRIKKGKLRGVESFGMMCSIEELGSDRNFYPDAPENGIYIFPENTPVGADAVEILGLHDTVFEYEITSNRVDCYGVMGIAREAAATFKKKFVPPTVRETGNAENISDYLQVEIKDSDLCSRYVARMVKNIRLAPSPEWMQRRLAASGIRPINNLVDITNFVMEEYGQPMHAFDYADIAGGKIIVRRAEDGEKFTTLDGQERTLDQDILMICDGEKSIGIGGIMGGENSMITDKVQTMVFEAATFDGTNIRLSAKRLGLRTDASGKFEKGLDAENALAAINRACTLIEELGAGEVVGGVIDIYPKKKKTAVVKFEWERINRLLGTELSEREMEEILQRAELAIVDAKTVSVLGDNAVLYEADALAEGDRYVLVPSFRQDILCMADIAEEVARFFGYDIIPTTLPTGEATMGGISYKLKVEEIVRNVAAFLGYSEAMSYSFESPKIFQKLLIPEGAKERSAIEILNPLGEDFSIMRTISLGGILQSLSTNYNRRNKSVRLYELASIYIPKALPLQELPDERMQLTLGFYGDGDFYAMKGNVEQILEAVGFSQKLHYEPDCSKSFLHPGRRANIIYQGKVIGYLGELHPEVADNFKIGEKTYIAVLDMKNVTEFAAFDVKFSGIARFPAMTRDLSMVVPKQILAGQIEDVFEREGGAILESYELFDIYEGKQVLSGHKSIAYSITFRHKERTLEDKEVAEAMERILKGLGELGISLRS